MSAAPVDLFIWVTAGMDEKELKHYASKIKKLENQCQNGKDVSENMMKMTKLFESLSLDEMFQLMEYIESSN